MSVICLCSKMTASLKIRHKPIWPSIPSERQHSLQIKLQKRVAIRLQASLHIRLARLNHRAAIVLHPQPHRLRRTQLRPDRIPYRHDIEQRGRLLPRTIRPLVIENGQRIRQRRSVTENPPALQLLQFNLRGIERHHVQRHARRKHFPRRVHIAEDVPFRLCMQRHRRIRESMTKATWGGEYPPNHPVFKESYSIAVQPSKETVLAAKKPAGKPKKREELQRPLLL